MRHLLANLATYAIGAALIVGAALFAWMRSAQLEISDERTILARFDPQPEDRVVWRELGQISYVANCSNCHGRDGEGWDQYPPLGHTAELFKASGGRDYLVDAHLYGLTSDRWRAPMPPMGHIRDAELAAILNYVLHSFGNEMQLQGDPTLYQPHDIEGRRGQRLTPRGVNDKRPKNVADPSQR